MVTSQDTVRILEQFARKKPLTGDAAYKVLAEILEGMLKVNEQNPSVLIDEFDSYLQAIGVTIMMRGSYAWLDKHKP